MVLYDIDQLLQIITNSQRFLKQRPHSIKEVEAYLKFRKKLEPEIVQKVLALLKEEGLADAEFARWFIDDKLQFKSYGLRRIRQELRQKGVSAETIEDVLADYDQETLQELESEKLAAETEKIKSRLQEADPRKAAQKLRQRLLAKGFKV